MQKHYLNSSAIEVDEIRRDFPILQRKIEGKPIIYLDNAATTQKPSQVIEAEKTFYETTNANIHRAVYTLSHEATVQYENAHRSVANFIGAESWREIIFTRNATEAINLVAYAWGLRNLQKGDEIITTIMEHHSNIVPWQMLRELKGIKLRFLDLDGEGRLRLEDLPKLISEKTKLVSVVHASNVLGVVNPVKEIAEQAKKVGALILVDAAQSVPHLPVDVSALGCDFLVASGHKMLGPTGIGFLYGRLEILEQMEPFNYGGDMIETVTIDKSTWNELPWKYEAGTPNIAGGIGLAAAIDYLNRIGLEKIQKYENSLTNYTIERLLDLPWIELYGPKDLDKLGVFTFNLKDIHPHDISWILDGEGIAVRSGHHCAQPLMRKLAIDNAVRASLYLYNTMEEIDSFIEALKKAQTVFRR